MTQHKDKVKKQKELLDKEKADNQVLSIDTRISNGKWTEQIVSYASGRVVTEFNDKRKKDIIENGN